MLRGLHIDRRRGCCCYPGAPAAAPAHMPPAALVCTLSCSKANSEAERGSCAGTGDARRSVLAVQALTGAPRCSIGNPGSALMPMPARIDDNGFARSHSSSSELPQRSIKQQPSVSAVHSHKTSACFDDSVAAHGS